MPETPDQPIPFFDVIVVGAGPGGCEAALAAARAGVQTLCLTISLDTIGFPPATPVLIENSKDVRAGMLGELRRLKARLPQLIAQPGVAMESAASGSPDSRLVVDRRRLGLAYKEALETTEGLQLRQALATALSPGDADRPPWLLTCGLGEQFQAAAVVIAAGTFLGATVDDAGDRRPGGRRGEIPSIALAEGLAGLGLNLVRVPATSNPRLDARSVQIDPASGSGARTSVLVTDGSQLDELTTPGLWPRGNRVQQLAEVRKLTQQPQAWMTRASYKVDHQVLAGGDLSPNLEAKAAPGLFFAGRAAGSCNYMEAAMLGLVAGAGAAARALGRPDPLLTSNTTYVEKLCRVIAEQPDRPVTIRIAGPGC